MIWLYSFISNGDLWPHLEVFFCHKDKHTHSKTGQFSLLCKPWKRFWLVCCCLCSLLVLPSRHRARGRIRNQCMHDINFHDKEYTSRFWLWFLHKNEEFDFTTQLDITNAKALKRLEAIMDTVAGSTWTMMKMKCVMKENWQVHDFPFDKQHLIHDEHWKQFYDVNSLIFLTRPKRQSV